MPVNFADFVMGHDAAGTPLHLVHCTTTSTILRMLAAGDLSPRPCPVYGESLLYLFYGRPAYKPAAAAGASGITELAPVCLILDPAVLGAAVRMLPFDSGGFARYAPLIGPGLTLPEFELANDATAPLRLVSAFYGTNANYYEQRPALGADALSISNLAARAYARLIADPAMREVDDRSGTIEIQFNAAIPLRSALRAIIGPAPLLDDPEVQVVLAECPGATLLPYKTYGRSDPASFAHALYERVETFLASTGAFA